MKSHLPKKRDAACPTGDAPLPPELDLQPMGNQAMQDALTAESQPVEDEEESFLHRMGEGLGLGAGFLVTELLALVPGWNDDLMDEQGQPLQSVEGAERVGDYNLEGRHRQVVGPQIAEYAEGLEPGMWRDFLEGVGEGATDAPGASYRLEAAVAEHFDGD
ncbi:MAG: hypothetical protein H6741_06220 [Alphaproteobacteria bacterium]|nr:hypothetical protein [Alphaproteobacteria bacterium]MCB9792305.1 hypothetical protein [Alphaproteobacteria bacterium]